jgi:hypothetical protein
MHCHRCVPLELAGIDINSAGGRLTPDPRATPSPFLFTLANTRNQVAYAIVAGRVTLEGSLELGAGVTAGPLPDDVTVQGAAINSGAGCFRYVPEPSSRVLLALAGLCPLLARGRRAFNAS